MTDLHKMLSKHWDGVFENIRNGRFVASEARECISNLKKVTLKGKIEKDIVSLIWFIPLFLNWNKDRCIEKGSSVQEYEEFENLATEEVIRILGVP